MSNELWAMTFFDEDENKYEDCLRRLTLGLAHRKFSILSKKRNNLIEFIDLIDKTLIWTG